MTPLEFERRYQPLWSELEQLLDQLAAPAKSRKGQAFPVEKIPQLYRQTCHHLALAVDRQYPHFLISRLHTLVDRGHQALYQTKTRFWAGIWRYVSHDFPQSIRDHPRLLLLSTLIFCGPLFALMLICYLVPEAVYSVFDPGQVAIFEKMYNPAAISIGRERGADSDFMMLGVYIRNNIGISFQVFASGLLAGVGSLFYLLLNGIFIGAVAGYLTAIGFGSTFWQFVCGHGAFELTAIVLSGVAGLKLGAAILNPGQQTRRDALTDAAKIAMRMMYGVAAMLLIAALIEAFWSSARWIPAEVKYAAAAVLWGAVLYYFSFQGRVKRAAAKK
ncbi:MAG: stage II sporulation protein M [Betaproteobacteria bacterium]